MSVERSEEFPINEVYTSRPEATGQASMHITSGNEFVVIGPGQQYMDQPRPDVPATPLRWPTAEELRESFEKYKLENPQAYALRRGGIRPSSQPGDVIDVIGGKPRRVEPKLR